MTYRSKNRWSVELFFKWVKQHLKIKKFWENLTGYMNPRCLIFNF